MEQEKIKNTRLMLPSSTHAKLKKTQAGRELEGKSITLHDLMLEKLDKGLLLDEEAQAILEEGYKNLSFSETLTEKVSLEHFLSLVVKNYFARPIPPLCETL